VILAKLISVLEYIKAWKKERENACNLEVILFFFKNHLRATNMESEALIAQVAIRINGLSLEKNREREKNNKLFFLSHSNSGWNYLYDN
jgi:hypothetical protein